MSFSKKKIVTAIAWGLAFDSFVEMVLAAIMGAWAGWNLGRGRDPNEVTATMHNTWPTLETVVPLVFGLIGFALGMAGRLPGTEDKNPDGSAAKTK